MGPSTKTHQNNVVTVLGGQINQLFFRQREAVIKQEKEEFQYPINVATTTYRYFQLIETQSENTKEN